MKKSGWTLMVAAALAVMPLEARAGGDPFSWNQSGCDGNNFVTCISAEVWAEYDDGEDETTIHITVTNDGTGVAGQEGIFATIGLINVPSGLTFNHYGSAPTGWSEPPPLPLGGLPTDLYGFSADNPQNGLLVGNSLSFSFVFDGDMSIEDFQAIGVGAHSISGIGGCSTKLGIFYDGNTTAPDDVDENNEECTPTEMPEPGTMVLFGTGLAAMLGIVRRREESEDAENSEA